MIHFGLLTALCSEMPRIRGGGLSGGLALDQHANALGRRGGSTSRYHSEGFAGNSNKNLVEISMNKMY